MFETSCHDNEDSYHSEMIGLVEFSRWSPDKLLIRLKWTFTHQAVPEGTMNLLFCFEVVDDVFL